MIPDVIYTTDKFVPKNISYSEKYVAFLDILGFSQLINNSILNTELQQNISESLTSIYLAKPVKWMVNPDGKHIDLPDNPDGIKTYVFSDNILITAPTTFGALNKLLNEIWNLYGSLAYKCQSFIRGSIVKGKIYDDTQIVFGPALIDAYIKEKDIAIYPRIILSNTVTEDYKQLLGLTDKSKYTTKEYFSDDEINYKLINKILSKQPIKEDFDGLYFLDVLSCHPSFLEKIVPNKPFRETVTHEQWLLEISKIITSNLITSHDEKIKMKYAWFGKYFNETIKIYSQYNIEKIDV